MLQPCLPNFSSILTLPLENTGDMANAKHTKTYTELQKNWHLNSMFYE